MPGSQNFYSKRLKKPFAELGNLADQSIAATGYESFRILFDKVMPQINKTDHDLQHRWSKEGALAEFNDLSSADKPWYAFALLFFAAKYWQTSDLPFNESDYENHKLLQQYPMDSIQHHEFWVEMHNVRISNVRQPGTDTNTNSDGFLNLKSLKGALEILCYDLYTYQNLANQKPRISPQIPVNTTSPYSIEASFVGKDLHGTKLWLLLIVWTKGEETTGYILKSTPSKRKLDNSISERWNLIEKITKAQPGKLIQVDTKCKRYTTAKIFEGTKVSIKGQIVAILFENHKTDTIARREWPVILEELPIIINPRNLAKELASLKKYNLKYLLNDDDELSSPTDKGYM